MRGPLKDDMQLAAALLDHEEEPDYGGEPAEATSPGSTTSGDVHGGSSGSSRQLSAGL